MLPARSVFELHLRRRAGWRMERFCTAPTLERRTPNVPATFPLLPLLIFCAELCVVTISTIRIIFLSRGMKTLAAILGFFEITIWLFAIGQIMRNLSDFGC